MNPVCETFKSEHMHGGVLTFSLYASLSNSKPVGDSCNVLDVLVLQMEQLFDARLHTASHGGRHDEKRAVYQSAPDVANLTVGLSERLSPEYIDFTPV